MGNLSVDYSQYTPVGDIISIASCLVFIILLSTSYIKKTKLFSIFKLGLGTVVVASYTGFLYHFGMMTPGVMSHNTIYVLRVIYHAALFGFLYVFLYYAITILQLTDVRYKRILVSYGVLYVLILLVDAFGSIFKYGFYIDKAGEPHTGVNIFIIGYILFVVQIFQLLLGHKDKIYKQVIQSIGFVCALSIIILALQGHSGQTSFTTITYVFPLYAIMYMIHSNPYDLESGALDTRAFEDLISYYHKNQKNFILMSLLLNDFEGEGKSYPEEINELVRRFASDYYKGAKHFQVTNGHMFLVAGIEKNPNYDHIINLMLNSFQDLYQKYRYDFKIVILKSISEVSEQKDYVSLVKFVESSMPMNDIHYFEGTDIDSFKRNKMIISQIEDICKKKNLNDERVLVYCQPVFNIQRGTYDTAEALMRLRLPDIGMVFPNEFIPIAEEHEFIHTLSLIILNKTCLSIKSLLDEGYKISRISVNISIIEMRDDDFCNDINHVIKNSGIPFDKIAIEITESQNEDDFNLVKEKIDILRESGIKFYLDDFGTGYSNLERIMELPFDIIKFDRSLVIASKMNDKSEMMVSHMARMFSEMLYSVLYEGVEDEDDEEKCLHMSAKYLQGYKYSKPIPIEKLRNYIDKSA